MKKTPNSNFLRYSCDHSNRWQGNLMPCWQFAFELVRGELENTDVDLGQLVEASGATNLPSILDEISTCYSECL